MEEKQQTKISKFMSLVLRHKPEAIDLHLDESGWADIDELLKKCAMNNVSFSKEELLEIVRTNDKQRFALNETKSKVRANQGHSVHIDLNLNPAIPPDRLFHGTVAKFLDAIKAEGLKKMQRQHVHLSFEISTAEKVGNRRGKAFVLGVKSGLMHHDGFAFYISDNGVWLTDHVPIKYIVFDNDYKTSGEL